MGFDQLTLGQRMVLAAKIAVARHLEKCDDQHNSSSAARRRNTATGGAGSSWVTDDPNDQPSFDARESQRA
jgi:hypothetical protein